MGLLSGLLGNASNMPIESAKKEYAHLLSKREQIEAVYKLVRDAFIFTDKRLMLVDVQGLTGKEVEVKSIPYKSITYFTVETTGHFDLDAELKIWISGNPVPIEKKFNKNANIYEVQSLLAEAIASYGK